MGQHGCSMKAMLPLAKILVTSSHALEPAYTEMEMLSSCWDFILVQLVMKILSKWWHLHFSVLVHTYSLSQISESMTLIVIAWNGQIFVKITNNCWIGYSHTSQMIKVKCECFVNLIYTKTVSEWVITFNGPLFQTAGCEVHIIHIGWWRLLITYFVLAS